MVIATEEIPSGYKHTEVGVIPADWDVKRLRDTVSQVIDNRGKTPPYSADGDIELIETAAISFVNRHPDYSKITKFVSKKIYDCWFRGYPKEGDVLVSTVGEYSGSSAIMGESRGAIAQNLIALRIKALNSTYVFYWTRSDSFKKQLEQVMMNQAQPSLRVPWLLNFNVSFPKTESEQNVIIDTLSDIDALIASLEKFIAKKRAIRQAVMHDLLTGKRRLPGFSGKWETVRLSDILDYERPDKYIVKDTEYLEKGQTPVLTANKSFILGYTNEDFGICAELPVIIFDDFTTDSKYLEFPFKIKSSAIKILRGKNCGTNLKYIYERMKIINFPLGDHKRYYISEYQNIEIPVPKLNEQDAIAQTVSGFDDEINIMEFKLVKYKMLKQGAMQVLLTGRIRLV